MPGLQAGPTMPDSGLGLGLYSLWGALLLGVTPTRSDLSRLNRPYLAWY